MTVNPRRADTRRNNERILEAAAQSLAESDEVSFNAIAREAGVGVGTVYRHFPTPEVLILAVYQRELRHLVDIVPALIEKHGPEQAFRSWADHFARYLMTKRGLANALRAVTMKTGLLPAKSQEAMLEAVTMLVRANIDAGTVRSDLDAITVLRALTGLGFVDPAGDWQAQAACLTDLLWRGMASD